MKNIILIILSIVGFSFTPSKPRHIGKSGVVPLEAYTQLVLGKNIGYYVTFKNNTKKSCDAIEWTAYFYNNFYDLKSYKKGFWSSGNIVPVIKPGETTSDLENVWVSGSTKVYITITRVHFVD